MLKLWVHRIKTERTREGCDMVTSLEDSRAPGPPQAPVSRATGRSWASRRRGEGGMGLDPGWGSLTAAREERGNSCRAQGGSGEVRGKGRGPGHRGKARPRPPGSLTCHSPGSLRGPRSWPGRAQGRGIPQARGPEGSHQGPCHTGPRGRRGSPCRGWERRSSDPGRWGTASCWSACSCSFCSGTRPGWPFCSTPCLWTTLQTPLVWALGSDRTHS